LSPALVPLVLRALVVAAATWGLWAVFHAFGLLFAAPLAGVLLARPLIDLAGDLKDHARRLAFDDVEGQHYSFKGRWVHVVEDADHVRWMHAEHVRKVVPGLPADESLLNLAPQGCRRFGRQSQLYLRAETVLDLLAKSTSPMTLRLRRWIEGQIVMPAQNRRARAATPPER